MKLLEPVELLCLFLLRGRIERLTGVGHAGTWVQIAVLPIYIGCTVLCFTLTHRRLSRTKLKYMLAVLWIPYYALFVSAFASLAPITDPQEVPLGGIGIVLLGAFALYPFYVLLVTSFATDDAASSRT